MYQMRLSQIRQGMFEFEVGCSCCEWGICRCCPVVNRQGMPEVGSCHYYCCYSVDFLPGFDLVHC